MPMPHPFPGAILKTSGTQIFHMEELPRWAPIPLVPTQWEKWEGGNKWICASPVPPSISGLQLYLFLPSSNLWNPLYYSRVETGVHSFPSSRCHRYQDLFTQSTFMCGSQVSNTLPVPYGFTGLTMGHCPRNPRLNIMPNK